MPNPIRPLLFFGIIILYLLPYLLHAQENIDPQRLGVSESLELAKTHEASGDLKEATRYLNLAAIQVWEEKNYEDAIKYFNRSIELNQKINNLSGISKLNSNLGMIYSDLRDFNTSLSYFQKSLDYRLVNGEKSEIISTYINKGVVLNNLNKHNEAGTEIEKALKLATEMSDASQMKSCYGILAETYEKAGNNEKTMHYFNLYRTFHEMIQRDKVNDAKKEIESTKMKALQTELEKKEQELKLFTTARELKEAEEELKTMNTEIATLVEGNTKQELAMSLLEREIELKEMKVTATEHVNYLQRIWITVGSVGTVIIVLFTITLYRNNQYKKQTNLLLASQNEEITSLNGSLEAKVVKRTKELQQTLVNLEIRNRDLDQFSHVISHNLRGPVASILGLSKIINQHDPADPINAEIFSRLVVSTQLLDDVVRDLSVILEIKDKQSLPKQMVDVAGTIASAKDLLAPQFEKLPVSIKINIENSPQILSVKPYLESIFYNLLSNSLKYKSSSRPLIISIDSIRTSSVVSISVGDNGIGIAQKNIARIFEPYIRLNMDSEGKGLGLYMVKAQVEALGGTVTVSSVEEEGTRFIIQLPQE